MRTMTRLTMLITICTLLTGLTGCGEREEPGVDRFVGTWTIDVDRSVAEARKSKQTADQNAAFFERRMGAMRIEVNSNELILFVRDDGNAMPFRVSAVDPDSATLAVTKGDTTHEAVLTQVDGRHMNIKLSIAPDFNACIWQRVL